MYYRGLLIAKVRLIFELFRIFQNLIVYLAENCSEDNAVGLCVSRILLVEAGIPIILSPLASLGSTTHQESFLLLSEGKMVQIYSEPKYPVIDDNPSMGKIFRAFRTTDWRNLVAVTIATLPFGYAAGMSCKANVSVLPQIALKHPLTCFFFVCFYEKVAPL